MAKTVTAPRSVTQDLDTARGFVETLVSETGHDDVYPTPFYEELTQNLFNVADRENMA
jgi:hypothetical protein